LGWGKGRGGEGRGGGATGAFSPGPHLILGAPVTCTIKRDQNTVIEQPS